MGTWRNVYGVFSPRGVVASLSPEPWLAGCEGADAALGGRGRKACFKGAARDSDRQRQGRFAREDCPTVARSSAIAKPSHYSLQWCVRRCEDAKMHPSRSSCAIRCHSSISTVLAFVYGRLPWGHARYADQHIQPRAGLILAMVGGNRGGLLAGRRRLSVLVVRCEYAECP